MTDIAVNGYDADALAYLFENASVGLAMCRANDNTLIMVNPAFARMHGYRVEELLGANPSEVFASECMARLADYEEQAVNGCPIEDVSFEAEHLRKDGSSFPAHVHITVIKDAHNQIQHRIANVQDISARKAQAAQLAAKEREFRTLAENTRDTMARYDKNCVRTYANRALSEETGLSNAELIGQKPSVYNTTEQGLLYERAIQQVYATGQASTFELNWTNKHGHLIISQMHIVPEKDDSGNIASVLVTGRDITQLKKTEIQLQQALTYNEGIISAIPDLLFEVDHKGKYLNIWAQDPQKLAAQKSLLLGRRISEFLDSDATEICMQAIREADSSGASFGKVIRLSIDGVENWFELSVSKKKAQSDADDTFIVLSRDITERKLDEQRIEYMAHHDELTKLPNRTFAKIRADQAMTQAKAAGKQVAFIFIDLDGFKTINDSLGHPTGDAMLKIIATRLNVHVTGNDMLSRHEGDAFLLILSDIEDIRYVSFMAQRTLEILEKPFQLADYTLSISGSIGIAIYPDHADTFESLLQCADMAMYKTKEFGKNGYQFYTPEMSQDFVGQFKIQSDLRKALQNNEFVLFYQPQISLPDHKVIGVEALVRWQHPHSGMMPPMNFIPIAESSGLIIQIGQWIIEEGCRQAARWHRMGIEITVAINISAVQFKRGNLENIVKNALLSSGLNPRFLELELTESILIQDAENILKTVNLLKSIGVQLSIDDFGTGYSSLAYLKRFAVDKLKIDQSFVRDILRDQEGAVIVKTIIQMANNLNLKTIAEGVEDADVLAVMDAFGCNEVQGYHFSKPLSASDFEHFYTHFVAEKVNNVSH